MKLPQDPAILLSYINTQLRDFYPSFNELCQSLCIDGTQVTEKLLSIGYKYDNTLNKFI